MTAAAEIVMGATASERIAKTTFPLPNEDSPDFAAFRELRLVKRHDFETLMDLMRYGLLARSVPQRQWPELARSIPCNRSGGRAAAEQARTDRSAGARLQGRAKRHTHHQARANVTE